MHNNDKVILLSVLIWNIPYSPSSRLEVVNCCKSNMWGIFNSSSMCRNEKLPYRKNDIFPHLEDGNCQVLSYLARLSMSFI